MTSLLPPKLLKLFAPRPQPQYLKPLTKDDAVRGPNNLEGVAQLVSRIREEAEDAEVQRGKEEAAAEASATATATAEANAKLEESTKSLTNGKVKLEEDEDVEMGEVRSSTKGSKGKKKAITSSGGTGVGGKKKKVDKVAEMGLVGEEARKMRAELRKKRREDYKKNLEKNYKPQDDEKAVGDPYKTLFISRLSKKTTETDLRREFEMYGNIERIRIVSDRKGKSKSYAFIVYERERDMKAAYKDAEGIPIHHKKILVDVERGRTVKGWKPHKLGGGLGGRPKPVDPAKVEAATPAPIIGPGGGFGNRGGFRGGGGGFRGGFGGDRGGRGGGFGGRGGFGGDRGGGFQGGRGGFGGDRGGFNDRGGGGFGGNRGGGGFGGRGGFQGGQGDSGFGNRGGFGQGPPGGGYGNQGGGFQQQNGGGFGQSAPGGYGPPGGGFKRDYDGGSASGGGSQGGFGASGGGFEDRDSKRMRY